jgi:hypothetical protein
MAIKGKGKTKTKQVTRPPKPGYTPPPVPFFARRWVQVTAAFVVGIFVVALFAWIRGNLRASSDDRAARQLRSKERTAMLAYQAQLDPVLTQIGTPQGPSFQAFPRLGQTIDAYGTGDAKASEASQTASDTQGTATKVGDALAKIDAAKYVSSGVPRAFASDVTASKSSMAHAVDLYRQSALLFAMALDATGQQQKDLLASAKDLNSTATEVFLDGYNSYVEGQAAAGTYQPQPPPGTGLPPGAGIPGGAPPVGGAPAPQPTGG